MLGYNNRLCQWAEDMAKVYNKIGKEFNYNDYNQSPLYKLNNFPYILICGIHLGSYKDDICAHSADDIMR